MHYIGDFATAYSSYWFEKGMKEGRVEGAIKMLIDLFKEGILTLAQAAQKANMSPEKFQNEVSQQQ